MVTSFETLPWRLQEFSFWVCFTLNWFAQHKDWAAIPCWHILSSVTERMWHWQLSVPPPPYQCLTTLRQIFRTQRSSLHWECNSLVSRKWGKTSPLKWAMECLEKPRSGAKISGVIQAQDLRVSEFLIRAEQLCWQLRVSLGYLGLILVPILGIP